MSSFMHNSRITLGIVALGILMNNADKIHFLLAIPCAIAIALIFPYVKKGTVIS